MSSDKSYKLLLELAARDGVISAADQQAAGDMLLQGKSLYDAIASVSDLSPQGAVEYIAGILGVEKIDLASNAPSAEFVSQFPARVMLSFRLLPVSIDDGELLVATSDPLETRGLDELRMLTGLRVRGALADADDIEKLLGKLLGVGAETMEVLVRNFDGDAAGAETSEVELEAAAGDASIITFVNQILTQAIDARATDVHIEPFEKSLRVRYRVDGLLQEVPVPREVHKFHAAIISRLKILGQLDIAEKRLPQDGRVMLRIGSREIDVRISVIPMLHGEAMVLRLLDRSSALLGLEQLGAVGDDLKSIDAALGLPHGIVLVTGPTGSGKTTTLYAALSRINDTDSKIVTIEDPIEYHLYGINQIPVSVKAGLSFAKGLRSILRHDPDIVLIGEIRDSETAEIAVQASLTGHLVFSTLHTNDAPSATMRLVDMGIEPYLVASSLEMVIAQRLVRTICPHCKCEHIPHDIETLKRNFGDLLPERFYHGTGCEHCSGTGYMGRRGIFEIMPVSETIGEMVLERKSSNDIRRQAIAEGMRTLRDDGWRLVRDGVTTAQEVIRLTKQQSTAKVAAKAGAK